MTRRPSFFSFFFFNDTATTEIYTLSLHDALPISPHQKEIDVDPLIILHHLKNKPEERKGMLQQTRSEEHTSELQSRLHLVCRLLLEKKKKKKEKKTNDEHKMIRKNAMR